MTSIEAERHKYRCPKCEHPLEETRWVYYCPMCLIEDIAVTRQQMEGER